MEEPEKSCHTMTGAPDTYYVCPKCKWVVNS